MASISWPEMVIAMNIQVFKRYTESRQMLGILYISKIENLTIWPQCRKKLKWSESHTRSIRIQGPSEEETNVSSQQICAATVNQKVNEYQWERVSGGLWRRAAVCEGSVLLQRGHFWRYGTQGKFQRDTKTPQLTSPDNNLAKCTHICSLLESNCDTILSCFPIHLW